MTPRPPRVRGKFACWISEEFRALLDADAKAARRGLAAQIETILSKFYAKKKSKGAGTP